MKNINQILSDLNCVAYSYNQEKKLVQKNGHSGGSTYGLAELLDIISELNVNNIEYEVDGDANIQL